MNGIKLVSTTLFPRFIVFVEEVTVVVVPLRVCSEVVVAVVVVVVLETLVVVVESPLSVVVTSFSVTDTASSSVPLQLVSHSFQTVPSTPFASREDTIWSYIESSLITTSGNTSTSFHSSVSGDSFKTPFQANTLYGLINSLPEA